MSLFSKIEEDLKPFQKSEYDLNKDTIELFDSYNISTEKGSISMLFANVINSSISKCYELINRLYKNSFISTAEGEYLDDIAKRYSIFRYAESDESDDSLRYRISIHNLYNSLSNFTGIRQRILDKYSGVEDIKIIEYNKGSGSCNFVLYLTSLGMEDFDSIKKDILIYSPPGVDVSVSTPDNIYYKLSIVIECKTELSDSEQIDTKKAIRSNLTKLFSDSNNRAVEYYEFINAIKISNPLIKSLKIIKSTVDDQNVKLTIIEPSYRYKNVLSPNTEITFV